VFGKEDRMSEFESIWNFFQRKLKPGTEIQNWTAYRGYLGDSMTIIGVQENSIEVETPKAENIQHVPKEDLKNVWGVWSDYKIQKVKRYELRNMTRFSKYIISIFRWYEEENKNG